MMTPLMVTDKIKTLAITKARVAELEKSIATELNRELSALPGKYGFDNLPAFFDAVKAAARGKPRAVIKSKNASGGKRRKRAVITNETKAKVKALVEGGKTGAEIAKAVGISLPSVQNIKKDLGLVKARK
ncbi:MAG: winged helix-turn-helix domain-containing protein [Opitutus sp.]